jgi:ornithine cyclodeaminase
MEFQVCSRFAGSTLGFQQLHSFSINVPIQTLTPFDAAPERFSAQTCVKSGYLRDQESFPFYVINVASGGSPWMENSGNLQLYSMKTGKLAALLLDQGLLTEIRTAAFSAVVIRHFQSQLFPDPLAPSPTVPKTCIGIIGTGIQARYQLRMILHVLPALRHYHVRVHGRNPSNVETYINEMTREFASNASSREEMPTTPSFEAVSSADDLLNDCSIIVTTTSSRSPVLGTTIGSRGRSPAVSADSPILFKLQLIICVGSDNVGKRELHPDLIDCADLLVADQPSQSVVRGEFQPPVVVTGADDASPHSDEVPRSKRTVQDIASLQSILNQDVSIDTASADSGRKVIIVDSSGIAIQDLIIAQSVYQMLQLR